MNRTFVLASVTVLLATPLSVRAQTTPTPISLDEAVRLAQRNSPQAVQARGANRSASARLKQSYAAFIPSLSVSAGGSRQLPASSGTRVNSAGEIVQIPVEPWSYSNSLGANLDLFDGGRRFYDLSVAKAGIETADAQETTQLFNIALNVKTQYYNSLAAREQEGAARAQLQQADEQYKVAVTQVSAGVKTRSDSLRAFASVLTARIQVLTAQNNIANADAALTRLIGSTLPVTAQASDTATLALTSIDTTLLYQLAERGPTVRAAQAQVASARASRRSANAPYLPTLSMSYSRGGSGTGRFGFTDDPYNYNGSIRFSASYPIFNGYQREAATITSNVTLNSQEANLRDARLLARQNLTQNINQLNLNAQQIALNIAQMAANDEDLRVVQQRYALGAATLLDVLQSQTALNQTRSSLIRARFDYRNARAQIETIIGQDLQ